MHLRPLNDCLGLSPPTRGNRFCSSWWRRWRGPIPAHAGEPSSGLESTRPNRAYPRSRGGTVCPTSNPRSPLGLSPLMRGNQCVLRARARRRGPIPAHAGEPRCTDVVGFALKAYPRSRGGTIQDSVDYTYSLGLSPLTRGNPSRWCGHDLAPRPIPAHAGEPKDVRALHVCLRAYPRSRGGTHLTPRTVGARGGLSPLTRGNLITVALIAILAGPIPAHAGEPFIRYRSLITLWAYPRSRGGTQARSACGSWCRGLSPLTRGNPRMRSSSFLL